MSAQLFVGVILGIIGTTSWTAGTAFIGRILTSKREKSAPRLRGRGRR